AMAKLILSMDGLVLKEIPLSKERTTIGRKPHNDIQIDNLAVSGEHAVIVTILNDCVSGDLGTTNDTLGNGNPVKKHFLQNNDIVELGKYRLKFVGEAPVPAATAEKADFEKTMVLRPAAMKAAAEQARAMGHVGADLGGGDDTSPDPGAHTGPGAGGACGPGSGQEPAPAGRDPDPLRRQRRQGARARQAAHHARQARPAGGGADAAPAGLLPPARR